MTSSKQPEQPKTAPGAVGAGSSLGREKGRWCMKGNIAPNQLLLNINDKSHCPEGNVPPAGDDEVKVTRKGFAVYEPPSSSGGPGEGGAADDEHPDDGLAEEWSSLSGKMFEAYGNTLDGVTGYMGPVGWVLTGVAAILFALRLSIESAYKVIDGYVLIWSAGAFIIGIFLLVFHLFHWLSNRTKRVALVEDRKGRLVVDTCEFLDVQFPGKGILLRCKYFKRELSTTPECVVCPHYAPATVKEDEGTSVIPPSAPEEDVSQDEDNERVDDTERVIVSGPLSLAKAASRNRQLLNELDVPKIGGDSGGDLDEENEKEAGNEVDDDFVHTDGGTHEQQ